MTTQAQALRTLASNKLLVAQADGDPDLLALACEDAAAINLVAALLERGLVDEAQKALDSMDTSPREYAYEALEAANA